MEFIDSHAHLMDEMFKDDLENVIENARNNNIKEIINIGYSVSTSIEACSIAHNYENMYAVIGLHPDECNQEDIDLSFIHKLLDDKVVAIGEIGLDYHYESTNRENQIKHFIAQINLANKLNLPVTIHSRDADMDMLKILKENPIKTKFVMHCFSSSLEIAKQIIKLGGYISLAGTVTYKNARNLLDVARFVPDDKLLIETDCPYLSPVPKRGKRNEPANVFYTAEKIAVLRNMTVEELASLTSKNTRVFFNITNT